VCMLLESSRLNFDEIRDFECLMIRSSVFQLAVKLYIKSIKAIRAIEYD
jgi:hypothetical protein